MVRRGTAQACPAHVVREGPCGAWVYAPTPRSDAMRRGAEPVPPTPPRGCQAMGGGHRNPGARPYMWVSGEPGRRGTVSEGPMTPYLLTSHALREKKTTTPLSLTRSRRDPVRAVQVDNLLPSADPVRPASARLFRVCGLPRVSLPRNLTLGIPLGRQRQATQTYPCRATTSVVVRSAEFHAKVYFILLGTPPTARAHRSSYRPVLLCLLPPARSPCMRLGGFVLHGNNVDTLGAALDGLKATCDEVLALDSNSTDGSSALVEAKGVRSRIARGKGSGRRAPRQPGPWHTATTCSSWTRTSRCPLKPSQPSSSGGRPSLAARTTVCPATTGPSSRPDGSSSGRNIASA